MIPPRMRAASAVLALIAFVTGCAPHMVQVPELSSAAREARYRQQFAARESLGAAVDAQVVLWARRPGHEKLPSAEGRLLLAGPDAFRLRIGSVIGTALDLAARGDSLTAYVPSRRQAVSLDAERDELGVTQPGDLGFRTLSGAWRIPGRAWSDATWSDTLLVTRWVEDSDSLAVAVGGAGLPVWTSITREGRGGVRVAYRSWDRTGGVAWPALLEISDQAGSITVACRMSLVRFQPAPDPARLRVPIPPSAERLTLAQLKRMLERLGVM
jgi:hypothetical protein